jgi:hypothetical protein
MAHEASMARAFMGCTEQTMLQASSALLISPCNCQSASNAAGHQRGSQGTRHAPGLAKRVAGGGAVQGDMGLLQDVHVSYLVV